MLPVLAITQTLPASSSRKGVVIRTECPPSGPPAFRDGVLYPGGEVVEIRGIERESDSSLRIRLRGAGRHAVEASRLLLPPQGEMLLARRALVLLRSPVGETRIDRVPRPGESPVRVVPTACSLEPVGPARGQPGGSAMLPAFLRAERPLPLIPGRRHDMSPGNSALVVLAGPRPLDHDMDALAARVTGMDALDPAAVEALYLSVYGIAPRLSAAGAGVSTRARRFAHWLLGEEYLSEIGDLLSEVLRAEGALPTAVARELCESDRYFLPRTLWRELLAAFEADGRVLRREGRLAAPDSVRRSGGGAATPATGTGGPPEARLSPAERSLLERISDAGTAGEHVKSQAMRPARAILSRLEELGLVVRLENGRLYGGEVYRGFAEIGREMDDRQAASEWGVSRNTAQHLMRRLVADGLLQRTSPRTVAPVGEKGGGHE